MENVTEAARAILAPIVPEESEMLDYIAARVRAEPGLSPYLKVEEREAGAWISGPEIVLSYLLIPVLTQVAGGALQALKEATKDAVLEVLKPLKASLLEGLEKQLQKFGRPKTAEGEASVAQLIAAVTEL